MDTRKITDRYHVSPQIAPEDCAALARAGFATIICNRPDAEIPPDLHADRIAEAAREAGLTFEALPLTHQTMTDGNVAHQARITAEATGPVLAYCASGTRCTVVWALAQAGRMPVDDILAAATRAGYDLAPLRPRLEALSAG